MPRDDDSVIGELEARRGRARRQPAARRPARGAPSQPSATETSSAVSAIGDKRTKRSPARSRPPAPMGGTGSISGNPPRVSEPTAPRETEATDAPPLGEAPMQLTADEPTANYAVRVRRSLDDLVAWRLAELRRQGVRTTKVQLTEMLLWELSAAPAEDLAQRLAEFRRHAPR